MFFSNRNRNCNQMIRSNCNRNRLHEFCNCPKSGHYKPVVIKLGTAVPLGSAKQCQQFQSEALSKGPQRDREF